MIKQMTKYNFVVFHEDTPAFLETLKSLGLMDITRSSKPATDDSRKLFDQIQRYSVALKELKGAKKEASGENLINIQFQLDIVTSITRMKINQYS